MTHALRDDWLRFLGQALENQIRPLLLLLLLLQIERPG